jgi:hypothetical protein
MSSSVEHEYRRDRGGVPTAFARFISEESGSLGHDRTSWDRSLDQTAKWAVDDANRHHTYQRRVVRFARSEELTARLVTEGFYRTYFKGSWSHSGPTLPPMQLGHATRLVPIRDDVIRQLSPERQADLEEVVNDAVEYLVALEAQAAAIDSWEAHHGEIPEADLAPYLQAIAETLAEVAEDQRRFAAENEVDAVENAETVDP